MRLWRKKNRVVPIVDAPEESLIQTKNAQIAELHREVDAMGLGLMQTKNAQIEALQREVEAMDLNIRAVKSENHHLRDAFEGKDSHIARLKQTLKDRDAKIADLEFKTMQDTAFGIVTQMAELKIMGLEKELKEMIHVAPCSWCQMKRDITVYSFINQTCGCVVCMDCLIKRGRHVHTGMCTTCDKYATSLGEFRFIYKDK
jgi:outer membrane murein-binding lipoprotein Lpp